MKLKSIFLFSLVALTIGIGGYILWPKDDLTWVNTKEKAIELGLKKEGIKKENIFGTVEESGEDFIFFSNGGESVVGVFTIAERKGKYSPYIGSPKSVIKTANYQTSKTRWDIKTYSGKKFYIYSGVLDDNDLTIELSDGHEVTPYIDVNSNIYYFVELKGN
ncbi:hypothetical protein WAK64_08390 [Bacillus spongiae]|uniref:Uncharacterized protein n=1 Tax=Bacillus spongiae TaxID=2683610 RepID=A0ABU8HCJ1_9BACI